MKDRQPREGATPIEARVSALRQVIDEMVISSSVDPSDRVYPLLGKRSIMVKPSWGIISYESWDDERRPLDVEVSGGSRRTTIAVSGRFGTSHYFFEGDRIYQTLRTRRSQIGPKRIARIESYVAMVSTALEEAKLGTVGLVPSAES